MRVIGCSGFSVPATKYLREFNVVEVAETALGVPGPAWIRRIRREAPSEFVFTALAPRALTASNFEPTAEAESAWAAFIAVARELNAVAASVTSPSDLPYSKKARASARTMLERIKSNAPLTIVWEPPVEWALRDAEAIARELDVVVARDPTRHPPVQRAKLAYYRMPGPAGHKSRYEEPGIESAARCLAQSDADIVICILANVDMYADARRLQAALDT
jgi:uncharacterized protein YecE (DUF72 family)